MASSPPPNDDLAGHKRKAPPTDFALDRDMLSEPIFNPFAALGLDPATATTVDVRPAWRRALRHVHESAVIRNPATATMFPSQVEVHHAYQWLSSSQHRFNSSATAWRGTHHNVFWPRFPVGAPRVFLTTVIATPSITTAGVGLSSPTPATPTPYRRPSPFTSGSGDFSGSTPQPPRKTRRTAATSTGAAATSATASGSSDNPVELSDSEHNADSDDTTSTIPTPLFRAPRPYQQSQHQTRSTTNPNTTAAGASSSLDVAASGTRASPPAGSSSPTALIGSGSINPRPLTLVWLEAAGLAVGESDRYRFPIPTPPSALLLVNGPMPLLFLRTLLLVVLIFMDGSSIALQGRICKATMSLVGLLLLRTLTM
jgi:hypothetical protein